MAEDSVGREVRLMEKEGDYCYEGGEGGGVGVRVGYLKRVCFSLISSHLIFIDFFSHLDPCSMCHSLFG